MVLEEGAEAVEEGEETEHGESHGEQHRLGGQRAGINPVPQKGRESEQGHQGNPEEILTAEAENLRVVGKEPHDAVEAEAVAERERQPDA